MVSAREAQAEKSNLLSEETEEIVVQLERNNCHRERAVTA